MTATDTVKKPKTSTKGKRPALPDTTSSSAAAPLAALVGDLPSGFRMVDLDRLVEHPRNPRKDMDAGDLEELAASIKAQGVRQNLLVVPDPGEEGRHMIVIGHRRARAARAAGLTQVPAVVDPDLSEAEQLELMLVENMQRSDLTIAEEASGFQGLLDLGMTRAQMAKATGVSPSKVTARLKVAKLPPAAQEKVGAGRATLEDVAELEAFEGDRQRYEQLLELLGSPQFSWQVQQAKQAQERERTQAEYRARLVELGATLVEHHTDLPEGSSYLGTYPGPRATEETISAGGVVLFPRLYSPEFEAYATPDADADTADPETDAAREAREQAARELAEQVHADMRAALRLRRAFLLPLCRGERRLTADESKVVLEYFFAALHDEEAALDAGFDVRVTAEWLGAYDPDDENDPARLDGELSAAEHLIPGTVPAQLYLAAAAASNEHRPVDAPPGADWRWNRTLRLFYRARPDWWSNDPAVVAWYGLLTALGYEPSQWEADRLAGQPWPDTEVETP